MRPATAVALEYTVKDLVVVVALVGPAMASMDMEDLVVRMVAKVVV
jgi:hypothetical protein